MAIKYMDNARNVRSNTPTIREDRDVEELFDSHPLTYAFRTKQQQSLVDDVLRMLEPSEPMMNKHTKARSIKMPGSVRRGHLAAEWALAAIPSNEVNNASAQQSPYSPSHGHIRSQRSLNSLAVHHELHDSVTPGHATISRAPALSSELQSRHLSPGPVHNTRNYAKKAGSVRAARAGISQRLREEQSMQNLSHSQAGSHGLRSTKSCNTFASSSANDQGWIDRRIGGSKGPTKQSSDQNHKAHEVQQDRVNSPKGAKRDLVAPFLYADDGKKSVEIIPSAPAGPTELDTRDISPDHAENRGSKVRFVVGIDTVKKKIARSPPSAKPKEFSRQTASFWRNICGTHPLEKA
jgi:hypothetical protein